MSAVDILLMGRIISCLGEDGERVTIANLVSFDLLGLVDYCYGVDTIDGDGTEKTDVYRRMVREEYPSSREFYTALEGRRSARRDEEDELARELEAALEEADE